MSEVTMSIALIFWHYLVYFYNKCPNYGYETKMVQSRGHVLIIGLYKEIINKYFYLKPQDLELCYFVYQWTSTSFY